VQAPSIKLGFGVEGEERSPPVNEEQTADGDREADASISKARNLLSLSLSRSLALSRSLSPPVEEE